MSKGCAMSIIYFNFDDISKIYEMIMIRGVN
jgi:hypothetical protein